MEPLSETDPAAVEARPEGAIDSVPRRYEEPARRFLESAGAGDPRGASAGFFLWLKERELLALVDTRLGSLRRSVRGLLRLYAEATVAGPPDGFSRADRAFDEAWRSGVHDRAVEAAKARLLGARRIVPFLVYQRYTSISGPDDVRRLARQMGLTVEDIGSYVAEVYGLIRAETEGELVADGESLAEWEHGPTQGPGE
jgi:hypothetical protein